ncbi:MAG: hypothetical protein AB7C95_00930 [Synergistaceae bacterium]
MGVKTPLTEEPEGDPVTTWYANAAIALLTHNGTTQIPYREMQAFFELHGLIGTPHCFVTVMDKAFNVFEQIAKEDALKQEKNKKGKGKR